MNQKDHHYKKVNGIMIDELGGKVMTEFATLRPETYTYLLGVNDENKKAKGTKEFVIKQKPKCKY